MLGGSLARRWAYDCRRSSKHDANDGRLSARLGVDIGGWVMAVLRVFEVEIKGRRGVEVFDSLVDAKAYAITATAWVGGKFRITPRTRFTGEPIVGVEVGS